MSLSDLITLSWNWPVLVPWSAIAGVAAAFAAARHQASLVPATLAPLWLGAALLLRGDGTAAQRLFIGLLTAAPVVLAAGLTAYGSIRLRATPLAAGLCTFALGTLCTPFAGTAALMSACVIAQECL